MSIADAFSDVPVASPLCMANSELMETNVVSDEVENGMQDDCAATDDSGCPSSSGSRDTVQDCTLTSSYHNVEQGTSSQKSDGDERIAKTATIPQQLLLSHPREVKIS